jgi:dihydrofolate synthase/folylpolyglutamate synthase
MAIETGLGGRLDATNIVDPLVSVITGIELEHTEYLGKTIAAIAGEKAGIIKSGKPLVLAEQNPEALEVFLEHAARKNSPLLYFPDRVELQNVRIDQNGTSFTLVIKGNGGESFPDLFVPIPGEIQAKNAGLAVLAVKTVYPQTDYAVIKNALAGFTLPARFERISSTPPLLIDGAHTARSVELCLKTFTSLYGSGGILLFGCAAEKDLLSMAKLCVPVFSRIIITKPGTFKKSNPEEIYAAFAAEAEKLKKPPELLFLPKTEEALEKAVNMALENGLPILAAGSFYLAGEIRNHPPFLTM